MISVLTNSMTHVVGPRLITLELAFISLENLYCPDAYSRTIKGSFFSDEYQFIKIGIKKCNKKLRSCARDKEVSKFFS